MKSLPQLVSYVSGKTDGSWVSFIPGIGNDATFWRTQAEYLGKNMRVLTFDPWGHHQSPDPDPHTSFQSVLDGVIQMWDRLGIEHSSVVGLGFGGSVSLALAINFPDRVDKVVACCCRPRQPDDRRDFWRGRQKAAQEQGIGPLADVTVDRWLSPEFRKQHPDVDKTLRDMMKRTSVPGYCAYVGAFIEMDFTDQLAQLQVPTMLVAAEHDHGGGPVDDMRQMATRIPSARFEVLAGSGHICNHEVPDKVNELLADFLL